MPTRGASGSSERPEDDLTPERRHLQRRWMVYDWANSAYATTSVAVFLGPYLTSLAKNAGCGRIVTDEDPCPIEDPTVPVLGLDLAAGSFYSYVLAVAIVLQVVVLPITGAIADRTQRKRTMLAIFAYVGAAAAAATWFLEGERYLLGAGLYLIANSAFGASIVVYNAFLVDIARPEERDDVSSRGWALGYLGGGLLLLVDLALFTAHDALGLSEGEAVRLCLLSAGLWWAAFTLVPLRALPEGRRTATAPPGRRVLLDGFRQLRTTLRGARAYPQTLLFLLAYLIYNDGIQSAIGLASVYGSEELDLAQGTLIGSILLVQFVAFGGALLLGRLARTYGAQRVVVASLLVWALVVGAAFFVERGVAWQFYALAGGLGLVLGGSQALSRSLYSRMVPPGQEAEYFSLYEISERGTSWLGAVTFGLVYQLAGSYRLALISLVVFFLLGAFLLSRVDVERAIREAQA